MTLGNEEQNISIIRQFLSELKEEDLYHPLHNLFLANGYEVWIVHGTHEKGKDLIATKKNEHNILINVKGGNIDQTKWKVDVYASISQMMVSPINHTGVDENLPRKHLLVFNGTMTPYVDQELNDFNDHYRKNGLPEVEVWNIDKLSMEFNRYLIASELLAKFYLEDIQKLYSQ